jgi:hypothetical protein
MIPRPRFESCLSVGNLPAYATTDEFSVPGVVRNEIQTHGWYKRGSTRSRIPPVHGSDLVSSALVPVEITRMEDVDGRLLSCRDLKSQAIVSARDRDLARPDASSVWPGGHRV